MRKQLLLLFFSLFAVMGFARTVTGVVKQASDKETIIGASVRVHGTTRGVTTDIDGKFQIDVQDGDVLDITYVGMNPVSVKVGKQTVIEVEMTDNSQVLSEVVVTAMGQTQEKKKLNFAVQSLNSDQVTAGSASNFANSLQGKVAGLQVSTGGGSPNSSTQVIIRAISSVNTSQNNEPLVIVDGVPVRGHGSSLGDINANDIENMSVLKGAAASALYGQEAANGVIMITTKSGSKDGKVTVNASASLEVSNAMRVPKLQKAFTPGVRGMYKENSSTGGWGPYMSEKDTYYANISYTSGTTADPKGILLTHRNYTANVEQGASVINIGRGEIMLIILPMDHCFAHVAGFYTMMSYGGSIATVPGKTPTAQLRNIIPTMQEIHPNVMLTVPAISRTFKKAIESGIKKKGKTTEKLYNFALKNAIAYNKEYYNRGGFFQLWRKPLMALFDKLIFSKVRETFGGKMRFCVGGGALLDIELQRYFCAIGMPTFQGYGLSEATPIICSNAPGRPRLSALYGISSCDFFRQRRHLASASQRTGSSSPGLSPGKPSHHSCGRPLPYRY